MSMPVENAAYDILMKINFIFVFVCTYGYGVCVFSAYKILFRDVEHSLLIRKLLTF